MMDTQETNKTGLTWVIAVVVALAVVMGLALAARDHKTTPPDSDGQETVSPDQAQNTGASTEGGATAEAEVAGDYKLSAMVDGDGETPSDYLARLEALGLRCSLLFRPDGTGQIDLFGIVTPLTWGDGKLTVDESFFEGQDVVIGQDVTTTIGYVYDSGTVTLNENGNTMVFTRKTAADLEAERETKTISLEDLQRMMAEQDSE